MGNGVRGRVYEWRSDLGTIQEKGRDAMLEVKVQRAAPVDPQKVLREIAQLCDFAQRTVLHLHDVLLPGNKLIDRFKGEVGEVVFGVFVGAVRDHAQGGLHACAIVESYGLDVQERAAPAEEPAPGTAPAAGMEEFLAAAAAAEHGLGMTPLLDPLAPQEPVSQEPVPGPAAPAVARQPLPHDGDGQMERVMEAWQLTSGHFFNTPMTANDIHRLLWGGKTWRDSTARPEGYFDIAPALIRLVRSGLLAKEKNEGKRQYLYTVTPLGETWLTTGVLDAPERRRRRVERIRQDAEAAAPDPAAPGLRTLDPDSLRTRTIEPEAEPVEVAAVQQDEAEREPEAQPVPAGREGPVEDEEEESVDY